MKLQFKHQKFQADAAKAVVDVFAGQPASSVSRYLIDRGLEKMDQIDVEGMAFPGWRNDWPEVEKERQEQIMKRSDKVTFVAEADSPGVYLLRDRKLVDGSACCISYCHRTTGGTAYTVRYAMKKGIPVYNASSWDLRQLG